MTLPRQSDAYVCPQCGPAPEGAEEHARRAHTAEGLGLGRIAGTAALVVWVVWVAGSEEAWYSTLLGAFEVQEEAIAFAREQLAGPNDPGDTIFVHGLALGMPDSDPIKVFSESVS